MKLKTWNKKSVRAILFLSTLISYNFLFYTISGQPDEYFSELAEIKNFALISQVEEKLRNEKFLGNIIFPMKSSYNDRSDHNHFELWVDDSIVIENSGNIFFNKSEYSSQCLGIEISTETACSLRSETIASKLFTSSLSFSKLFYNLNTPELASLLKKTLCITEDEALEKALTLHADHKKNDEPVTNNSSAPKKDKNLLKFQALLCLSKLYEKYRSPSEGSDIGIWNKDLEGTYRLSEILMNNTASITSITLSLDGTTMASGTAEGEVIIWKLVEARWIFHQKIKILNDRVDVIALSRDATTIIGASEGDDNGLKVLSFDYESNQYIVTQELYLENFWVDSIAFSPTEEFFAATSFEGPIALWILDGNNRWKQIQTLDGSLNQKKQLGFSSNGEKLISISMLSSQLNGGFIEIMTWKKRLQVYV